MESNPHWGKSDSSKPTAKQLMFLKPIFFSPSGNVRNTIDIDILVSVNEKSNVGILISYCYSSDWLTAGFSLKEEVEIIYNR